MAPAGTRILQTFALPVTTFNVTFSASFSYFLNIQL